MPYSSSLSDYGGKLVLDASVVINLCASGFGRRIVSTLPNQVVVTDSVLAELRLGLKKGHQAGHLLGELIRDGSIELGNLGPLGLEKFFELTGCGDNTLSLADGEASTLALAWERGVVAIVDEKKALRICGEHLQNVISGTTIDMLALDVVRRELGQDFNLALLNALQIGRMRVLPCQLNWVLETIGLEQARSCTNLPRTAEFSRRLHN